jgi:hypothetical protein
MFKIQVAFRNNSSPLSAIDEYTVTRVEIKDTHIIDYSTDEKQQVIVPLIGPSLILVEEIE